jgi:hypothetical protein
MLSYTNFNRLSYKKHHIKIHMLIFSRNNIPGLL